MLSGSGMHASLIPVTETWTMLRAERRSKVFGFDLHPADEVLRPTHRVGNTRQGPVDVIEQIPGVEDRR